MITLKIAELILRYDDQFDTLRAMPAFHDYIAANDDACSDRTVCFCYDDSINMLIENEAYRDRPDLIALALLAERLPEFNRVLMHGVAITFQNRAFIFTAPSGVGKSTHALLWKRFLKNNVAVLNGDKPIVALDRRNDGQRIISQFVAYGTPWAGKEGWQIAASAPIEAICLIRRSENNRIRRVSPCAIIDELMCQFYFPHSADSTSKTLELIGLLLKNCAIYIVECNMTVDAVKTSFEGLTGQRFEEYSS